MRQAVIELLKLGPLPSEEEAEVEQLKVYRKYFDMLTMSVTDEEAATLVTLFGPDTCFGGAWKLLHLIESAPNWSIEDYHGDPNNEMIILMKKRAENSRLP